MSETSCEEACTMTVVLSRFPLEANAAAGKKAAKKKGSSFQTVSALFRVQTSFSLIRFRKLNLILLCGKGELMVQGL